MTRTRIHFWLLATLCVQWGVLAAASARADLVTVAAGGSPLLVHGIPIPEGAEPSLAASVSLDNLHVLAPRAGELGSGRLRAVVYDYQGQAPPDQVAEFYRQNAPYPFAPPSGRSERGEQRREPDDGMRVLQLARPPGYLAIRSQEDATPTRITVALVEGRADPAAAIKAVDALRVHGGDLASSQSTTLVERDTWDSEVRFQDSRLQLLQQKLLPAASSSSPVIEILRTLLSQARSVWLRSYQVERIVPAVEMLRACQQLARQRDWQLLSLEADTPPNVMAIYRYTNGRDRGLVMLHTGREQARAVPVPGLPLTRVVPVTTEISRLEVSGPSSLRTLFRSSQPRVPTPGLMPLVPAFPRGSSILPPAQAPFSAQPRNK
jgi:hypothetical protein